MKLIIGENLRRLRREKDITQEELAEVLGVSFQSVSRWENGLNYPDLELLPVIAGFFGVTTDALIGADEARERERVNAYLDRFQAAVSTGDIDACIAIAREGVSEYPNHYALLNKLMYALFLAGDDDGSIPDWQENQKKYDAEITALGERIMKYCPDPDLRCEAMARLGFNHCEMGRRAQGRAILEQLPAQEWCREARIWYALEPEEKLPWTRRMIQSACHALGAAICHLVEDRLLPDEQLLAVLEKEQALEALVWDDAPPKARWRMANDAFRQSELLVRLGRHDEALTALERAADCARAFDGRPGEESASSLLFGEVTFRRDDYETDDRRPLREILRDKWLSSGDFDVLRDDPRFRRLIGDLGRDDERGPSAGRS